MPMAGKRKQARATAIDLSRPSFHPWKTNISIFSHQAMDKEPENGSKVKEDGDDKPDTQDEDTTNKTNEHDESSRVSAMKEEEKDVHACDSIPHDGSRDEVAALVSEEDSKQDYGMSLLQDSIYFDNEIQVHPQLIESLTTGFTDKFLPSLERNRKTIGQIKSSQAVLIETVQQENAKFEECQANQGLDKTMTKAKLYHTKLLRLRKEMTVLYEKSAKLKRRALRLQQQKQKEEMSRAQQMEVEYEKEKMLTARVASSSPEKET